MQQVMIANSKRQKYKIRQAEYTQLKASRLEFRVMLVVVRSIAAYRQGCERDRDVDV